MKTFVDFSSPAILLAATRCFAWRGIPSGYVLSSGKLLAKSSRQGATYVINHNSWPHCDFPRTARTGVICGVLDHFFTQIRTRWRRTDRTRPYVRPRAPILVRNPIATFRANRVSYCKHNGHINNRYRERCTLPAMRYCRGGSNLSEASSLLAAHVLCRLPDSNLLGYQTSELLFRDIQSRSASGSGESCGLRH